MFKQWPCCSRTLGDDSLAARCLTQNSYLIDGSYERHLAAKLSSPKVREQHDHCLNIIMERTGSDKNEKIYFQNISTWISKGASQAAEYYTNLTI